MTRILKCMGVFLFVQSGYGQDGTLNPVIDASRARQAKFQSVTIEFTIVEEISKGSLSARGGFFTGDRVVPDRDIELKSTNRISFDGDKVRIENNHPLIHMPSGELVPRSSISVFNGEIAKVFYPEGLKSDGVPGGIIQDVPFQEATKDAMFFPVIFFCRALDRAICPYPLNLFKGNTAKLPIQGVECVEYNRPLSADSSVGLFLAESRNYVLARRRTLLRGRVSRQVDINYRNDPSMGWVLESWTSINYGADGKIANSFKAHVTELKGGQPIAPDQFDVRFPEGSIVADQRNGKNYRIKADGSMRELTIDGEELSEWEYQPGTSWLLRHRWLIAVSGVVVLILVSMYFVRSRRVR